MRTRTSGGVGGAGVSPAPTRSAVVELDLQVLWPKRDPGAEPTRQPVALEAQRRVRPMGPLRARPVAPAIPTHQSKRPAPPRSGDRPRLAHGWRRMRGVAWL